VVATLLSLFKVLYAFYRAVQLDSVFYYFAHREKIVQKSLTVYKIYACTFFSISSTLRLLLTIFLVQISVLCAYLFDTFPSVFVTWKRAEMRNG